MASQTNGASPFTGMRAYIPSPERNPKNNITDDSWLKSFPPKDKRGASAICFMGDEPCDYCFPPNSIISTSRHLEGLDFSPIRRTPLYRSRTDMLMPRPMPYPLAAPYVEQTLREWELKAAVMVCHLCYEGDDPASFPECLLDLMHGRFAWVYRALNTADFEIQSMKTKLDFLRYCATRFEVEKNALETIEECDEYW